MADTQQMQKGFPKRKIGMTVFICKNCGEPFKAYFHKVSKKSKVCPYCHHYNYYKMEDILLGYILYSKYYAKDKIEKLSERKQTLAVKSKIRLMKHALRLGY